MTKADFLQWKQLPETQEVLQVLKETKQLYLEQMPGLVTDHIRLAKQAGSIETLDYLINIEWSGE
mgnify:CR=1 FL=1